MSKRNKSRSLGREKAFKLSEEELELYKKIRAMIGVVKERKVTGEERRKWAEEFAKEDTSNIFKEFGLE
jgi:hypothetical protein